MVDKNNSKSVLWIKMHAIQAKLGVNYMYDLTIKTIKGINNTKTSTNKTNRKIQKT